MLKLSRHCSLNFKVIYSVWFFLRLRIKKTHFTNAQFYSCPPFYNCYTWNTTPNFNFDFIYLLNIYSQGFLYSFLIQSIFLPFNWAETNFLSSLDAKRIGGLRVNIYPTIHIWQISNPSLILRNPSISLTVNSDSFLKRYICKS